MWQNISEIIIQYICAIIFMVTVYYFGKSILGKKTIVGRKKFFVLLQIASIIYAIISLNLSELISSVIESSVNKPKTIFPHDDFFVI